MAVRHTAGQRGRGNTRVQVAYEYAVGGTPYRGTRVRYRYLGGASRQAARDLSEQYPTGAAVAIHHHPTNPGASVLLLGIDRSGLLVNLVVGLAILAFGLFRAF